MSHSENPDFMKVIHAWIRIHNNIRVIQIKMLKLTYLWCFSEASPRRCSVRKVVLRNFAKFTGKHQCQCLLYNKVAIKKETLAQVNFAKFLRAPVFYSCGGCFCQQTSRLSILMTSINHCIWNTETMVAETNYEVVKFCNLMTHIGPQQNIRSVIDLLWSIIFTTLCCYKRE